MVETRKQIRAAIYLRVSTDDQKFMYGADLQKDAILAYIKSRGQLENGDPLMVLAGDDYIYQDDAVSGTIEIRERPDFKRLMEDIEFSPVGNKPFDAVIVYKVDRFARKLTILLDVVEFFQKHKIKFISVNEAIDTSTPFGKAILNIMGVIAELEIETTKMRTSAGIEASIKKGTHAHPPYGYIKNIEKRLEIFEVEAKIVRLIYQMCVIEDKNPKQIADWLRDNKKMSPEVSSIENMKRRGKSRKINSPYLWTTQSIRNILSDEVYLGKHYYNKMLNHVRVPKEKWQLASYQHPPIIEVVIFDKAQLKLKASANKSALSRKREGERKYPLSALIKCGYCSKRIDKLNTWSGVSKKAKKKDGKYSYYYICGHKHSGEYTYTCPTIPIPAIQLENYVIAFVVALLKNPKAVYDYQIGLKSSRQRVKLLKQKRITLAKGLQDIPQRKENLSRQEENSLITYPELTARLAEIDVEERKWQKEYREIDDVIGKFTLDQGYIDSFEKYSKKYSEILKNVVSNSDELYSLLHGLIEEIVVHTRPFNPKFDVVTGRKKKDQSEPQQIPNEIEIVLKLPKAILGELVDQTLLDGKFEGKDDEVWAHIESNYGPLSYQESVLPLNYAPNYLIVN